MSNYDLASLAQQLEAYQGGYRPEGERDIDKAGKLLGIVGDMGMHIQNYAKQALAMKKQQLENRNLQAGQTPYRDIALPLTQSNATISADTTPEQRTSMNQLYSRRENIGDVTLDQMKEMATISALSAKANPDMLPISALPQEAQNRAVAAGFDPQGMINIQKFNAFKTFDPSSMVPAISGESALSAGSVPAHAKIISPMQTGISPYADVRATQNIMSDLPSRSGVNTPAGAASTVQFSARQGKQLIANPGSPQRLALSAVDLARTVQRNAPTVDTLTNAGFADNLATKLSLLSQKITTDPSAADVPKLRKEIFDIFTDLENSSKPAIQRQLGITESMWRNRLPPDWGKIKAAELGENQPEIIFNETSQNQYSPDVIAYAQKHGVTNEQAQQIKIQRGGK